MLSSFSVKMCENFSKSVSSVLAEITVRASSRDSRKSGDLVTENDEKVGKKFEVKRKRRPFTVLVEGNIGSGKTTFLDHFEQIHEVERIHEPVSRWRDLGGHNLLKMMYEDPARWSLTFQTYVQLTMVENHMKNTDKGVKIMERSLYSAKYCFVQNLLNSHKMPLSEYEVLTAWFNYLTTCPGIDLGVDLIIYMRTEPQVAMERVKRRNRGEEHLIPLSYIQDLHQLHEDWLINEKFPLPAPVIVVDANKSLESMEEEFLVQQELILGELKENRAGNVDKGNVATVGAREPSKRPLSDGDNRANKREAPDTFLNRI